jgi:hypothetical protein
MVVAPDCTDSDGKDIKNAVTIEFSREPFAVRTDWAEIRRSTIANIVPSNGSPRHCRTMWHLNCLLAVRVHRRHP